MAGGAQDGGLPHRGKSFWFLVLGPTRMPSSFCSCQRKRRHCEMFIHLQIFVLAPRVCWSAASVLRSGILRLTLMSARFCLNTRVHLKRSCFI